MPTTVVTRTATPLVSGSLDNIRNLRDLFNTAVRQFGNRPALRDRLGSGGRSVTYNELGVMVADFAAGITRLGMRPGDKVAIIKENSIDWAVSWFGTVLAGGVIVPIYGELAANEMNNVIRQSDARYAIISSNYVQKIDARPLERVIVAPSEKGDTPDLQSAFSRMGPKASWYADVTKALTEGDHARSQVDLRPGDLAALIYTSGTISDPKGVMLSHRNLASEAIGGQRVAGYVPNDRLLIVLPMHHAFPFSAGLLCPLWSGSEIVYDNDLRRISQRMAEVKPTIFFGVPALFGTMHRTILAKLESEGKLGKFLKAEQISLAVKRRTGINIGGLLFRELHEKLGGNIRYFGSGGSATPPETIRKFAALGVPLMQGWGLTEASPVIAGQTFNRARFLFTGFYEKMAGSTGLPLSGDEIVCADVPDKNIFVSIHGEGEFLVRGPNVMSGYYRNEAATREVMVDDWLRTGDIGRIDGSGNIFITGRAKSVIVLESGEKVYPDELEEHFEPISIIRDVAIIGKKPLRLIGDRKTQVAAVIYPDPMVIKSQARETGEQINSDMLRRLIQREVDRVQANLAPFKRITEVILTDQPLPRTDLKKIRRGQIRDHYSFDIERLFSGDDELIS